MKNKVLMVLSTLFGLMFINSGLNKLFNYIPVPDDLPENLVKMNNAFAEISWLMPLVAIVEIAGGALFIMGKTRALGAVVIFPIMTGVVCVHVFAAPSGLPIAAVLLGINLWAMYENREKYLPMVR